MPNRPNKKIFFDGNLFYNYVCTEYGSLLMFTNLMNWNYQTVHRAVSSCAIGLDLLIDICELTGKHPSYFTNTLETSLWRCPVCQNLKGVCYDQ